MDRRPPYATLPPPSHAASSSAESEGRFGSPVEPYRVLRTLVDGRKWPILAVIVGALAGLTIGKLMARTFKSTVVLKFEGNAATQQNAGPLVGPTVVNIAAETLRGEKVVSEYKRRMQIQGPSSVIGRTLEATAESENGLLRVTTSAPSAQRAALLANSLAEILIHRLNELERERFLAAKVTLLERSRAQERELARVRRAYDAFRESHGISNLTTEQEEGITSAAELRAQRDLGEAEIRAIEARVAQLRRDSSHTPRMVTTTSGVSAERTELARLESELTSARSSLSEDHPRVKALELQVAGLRRRLEQGRAESSALTYGQSGQYQQIQTSLSAAESDLAAARERMKGLRDLAARAQTRVSEFSQIEGEAATLLAQVRVNEQLSSELQDQLARVENSARQGDAGFRVLSSAQVPEMSEPTTKKKLVAVGIPAIALLIAAFVLIARELRGLRIKTARELAYWGRGPVVASTTWPRDLHALDDLIGDMDDCAPAAAGRTLIVGLSDAQSVLAQTIASRLGEDWRSSVISMHGSVASSWRPPATPKSTPPGGSRSQPPAAAREDGAFSKKVTLMGYATPVPEHDSTPPPRDTFTGHDSPHPDPLHVPPTAITTRYRAPGLPTGMVPYRDVEPWDGPLDGPSLRRAARLADRVAVVVPAGACSLLDVASLHTRLGRVHGVGFILVDVASEFARLADRSGPVEDFWSATRVE